MKKETGAIFEMIVCACLWSIAGIFMKLIPWNGFAVSGMRSLVAGITIGLYMILTSKKLVISKTTVLSGIMTGCVYTCFTVANKLTTAANAIVLQFTSPVFIVVFSAVFLKEKIKKNDLTVVLLTLLGISLFFFDRLRPGYILGNIVAIAAGAFMAGMFIAVGNTEGDSRFSTVLIGQIFTFLVGLPFIIATKPDFSFTPVISVLILGVFQLGISYILYVKASMVCSPLSCCLIGALEPLLNPVWVLIFDGEKPGIFALIGAVIVVVSITVWTARKGKNGEIADA